MSTMISNMSRSSMVAAGAGLMGAAFVGYCIYFDHKRRTHPDFKKKLREKRAAARQNKKEKVRSGPGGLPDFRNPTEMQAYFLQECQMGEELLAEGNLQDGVEHLSNAVAMCGQPQQLLQIFQQTLPPEVFGMLAETIPRKQAEFGKMMRSMAGMSAGGPTGDGPNDIDEGPTISLVDDSELE